LVSTAHLVLSLESRANPSVWGVDQPTPGQNTAFSASNSSRTDQPRQSKRKVGRLRLDFTELHHLRIRGISPRSLVTMTRLVSSRYQSASHFTFLSRVLTLPFLCSFRMNKTTVFIVLVYFPFNNCHVAASTSVFVATHIAWSLSSVPSVLVGNEVWRRLADGSRLL